ncbi:MAG: hypothetical protein E7207_06465 [Clostridium butyricum]|nr:hypothetical protein [Clostridium butyricum]
MTILDLLNSKIHNNDNQKKALETIKETYMPSVNNNYLLVVNDDGKLMVRIPDLKKRDEYVFSPFTEYPYPLVMCMKIDEINNPEYYEYISSTFMTEYKDKLDVYFKDTAIIDKLLVHLTSTRNIIDTITYSCTAFSIFIGILLCIFNISGLSKHIMITGILICFAVSLYVQLSKENRIKKIIDGYISIINTDWYHDLLRKQYAFFCNFIG